jgi:hypothetical protein
VTCGLWIACAQREPLTEKVSDLEIDLVISLDGQAIAA